MLLLCTFHPRWKAAWVGSPAGFFRGAGYFFTFYLICISSMIQMSAVYRLLAAASPNMDIASATGECLPC